ncbi:hypothetical protein EVG20_g1765 [Dentipellis fragilis]|uniref:Pinin/SDK/MemA protein domain-containing protein n=1 Tax=Dentipellis fragilis TaxID=205917 RepID=A0A4Y9ZAQ5_9AGAM|nr:hypothetical protein EVG20_g1765 [Dentipellis fragilis]
MSNEERTPEVETAEAQQVDTDAHMQDTPTEPAAAATGRKRPRLDMAVEPRERKRGKSMFGLVLGTLNRAKNEDKERNASEAAKKRQLIEQRLQDKLRKETDSVRRAEEAKKDKVSANRKEEELQLMDSIHKLRRTRLPILANFLSTADVIPSDDASPPPTRGLLQELPRSHPPPLYYLPAKLTPAQEAFITKRKSEVKQAAEAEWDGFLAERTAGVEEIRTFRQRVAEEDARKKAEREANKPQDQPMDAEPTRSEPPQPEAPPAEPAAPSQPEPTRDAAMEEVDQAPVPDVPSAHNVPKDEPKGVAKSAEPERKDEPAPRQLQTTTTRWSTDSERTHQGTGVPPAPSEVQIPVHPPVCLPTSVSSLQAAFPAHCFRVLSPCQILSSTLSQRGRPDMPTRLRTVKAIPAHPQRSELESQDLHTQLQQGPAHNSQAGHRAPSVSDLSIRRPSCPRLRAACRRPESASLAGAWT